MVHEKLTTKVHRRSTSLGRPFVSEVCEVPLLRARRANMSRDNIMQASSSCLSLGHCRTIGQSYIGRSVPRAVLKLQLPDHTVSLQHGRPATPTPLTWVHPILLTSSPGCVPGLHT